MSDALLKSLDQISADEFERVKTLAQKRAATDDPFSLSLGLLVGNLAFVAIAFFVLRALPIVWTPTLIIVALVAGAVGIFLFWRGAYQKFEKPKEQARKQLAALQAELRTRDMTQGRVD